ncbi:MAG TPA: prolyl aminopeptidase [Rhizomicrobium sp.]|nr:prolyl aminopeptidase [Rhizomicrobium sp.]
MFADISPYRTGMLRADAVHMLYWEEVGNPQGIPLVFLHGGPGAGTPLVYRQHFDPNFWRLVFFDQRGAGRSTPLAELKDNTTQHLIDDIERLRNHLEIDRWAVAGASWGTTLALAYGEQHPASCLGFLLRGIFLGHQNEVDWFLSGIANVFPEAWRDFAGHVGETEPQRILFAYCERLAGDNPIARLAAAYAWSRYEGACSSLLPETAVEESFADETVPLGLAKIESHYFANSLFLAPNALLEGLAKITDKPAVIVQGRYDMICPVRTANTLARAWPGAEYHIVPDGGHSGQDPAIAAAQIAGGEALRRLLT